jgi:tetratricopeptide (TPR) repeat protein
MDSKLSRWCEGFIEAGWLAAVIAIPLFFNVHSSRVFEPDKLTLLRSIALLMSLVWLVKFIDGRGWQQLDWLRWNSPRSIWRMPFILPVFLLVVIYLVSTLFSVTPRVSWAGSYQRLQGTYTTLSYIVIFSLMVATMRTRAQVDRIVTAVIITSIPISLYGLLQHFNLDPLPWGGDVQRRIAGHMGNAIFIAAYLIMAVPLTVARIIDAFTNILGDEEMSYADVIRSSIYIFTFFIQLLAIYWSGSRGPWLGLVAGLFAFALILLVALRNTETEGRRIRLVEGIQAFLLIAVAVLLPLYLATGPLRSENPVTSLVIFAAGTGVLSLIIFIVDAVRRGWRWVWLDWISLAVLLGAFLVLFNIPSANTEAYLDTPIVGDVVSSLGEWRNIPGIGRLGRVLEDDRDTGKVRVLIWQGVLDLLQPHPPLEFPDGQQDSFNFLRPLIGYGPESMYVAYNRFYPPELATVEARNASPDRSHNETFDALVITGALGFVFWQALYVSVFYYAFRWLGVVRNRRDRNLLIGLWIAGAAIVGVAFSLWRGPVYLGVAIPFGSILGLVLYLIGYALLSEPDPEAAKVHPFQLERLLMMALVGAVVAHYVEIHFGIAIAATRTHFFAYVALLFVIGYLLPRANESVAAAPAAVTAPAEEKDTVAARKRRRTTRAVASTGTAAQPGWLGSALAFAFIMALIVGILGYEFMNYSAPPGTVISTIDDVPTPGEIFHQALLVNASENFTDSPFIFLMITLTWALGTLIALSEMAKQRVIYFSDISRKLAADQPRLAAASFALVAALGLVLRFITPAPDESGTTRLVGVVLLWLWTLLAAIAAVLLFTNHAAGRRAAGIIGMIGVLVAIPLLAAGGSAVLYGLLIGIGSAAALYLLWDSTWNAPLGSAAIIGLIAISTGLAYAFFQAYLLRTSIIGIQVQGLTDVERRVLEAGQQTAYLSLFYFFAIGLLVLLAFAFTQLKGGRVREAGSPAAFAALVVLIIAGLYAVYTTNLRIIHADIVYKRGGAFDEQAIRTRNPADWDYSIAIYERAIELAPLEDFYYLWLGRAYLEKSSATTTGTAQTGLMETARDRLVRAQEINPLNTDHTANLARLSTRWADLTAETERAEKIEAAVGYYEAAIKLSPQNAVIRNEYARLVFVLLGDCDRSLALYDNSLAVDAFYTTTYFEKADIAAACATQQTAEEDQQPYYDLAFAALEEGLERRPTELNRWRQLASLYVQLEENESALTVYEEALEAVNPQEKWIVQYLMAQLYQTMGDNEQARELAQEALTTAPPEQASQIQTLLDQLSADSSATP